MTAHGFELAEGDGDRDGIGGRPYLRDGVWPVCTHDAVPGEDGTPRCERYGQRLTHFLRFDVRPEFGLPFPVGSHFSLFLCPACADAVIPPEGKSPFPLPERFWEGGEAVRDYEAEQNFTNFGWWYASLEPPGAPLVRAAESEPNLVPARVSSTRGAGAGLQVGGRPKWLQRKEGYVCACGATMAFLLQISERFRFAVTDAAPLQAGVTWSKGRPWATFLGNQVYVLACPDGCHPRAVMVVNQN